MEITGDGDRVKAPPSKIHLRGDTLRARMSQN
jgi:hypothetical protein